MTKPNPRITATWNPHRGEETKLTVIGLEDLDRTSALDFLQDVLGDLQAKYDAILADGGAK